MKNTTYPPNLQHVKLNSFVIPCKKNWSISLCPSTTGQEYQEIVAQINAPSDCRFLIYIYIYIYMLLLLNKIIQEERELDGPINIYIYIYIFFFFSVLKAHRTYRSSPWQDCEQWKFTFRFKKRKSKLKKAFKHELYVFHNGL